MKRPRVLVVDYGSGNVRSVCNALDALGCAPLVSADPDDVAASAAFVYPGVGVFGEAVKTLERTGMADRIAEEIARGGKPLLGICLGMQILACSSEESPGVAGLGWIRGKVLRLEASGERKVPNVGWNDITITRSDPLFGGVEGDRTFYFVHGYGFFCDDDEQVLATFDCGRSTAAVVRKGNIVGTQFHPELSSRNGLALLRNFVG